VGLSGGRGRAHQPRHCTRNGPAQHSFPTSRRKHVDASGAAVAPIASGVAHGKEGGTPDKVVCQRSARLPPAQHRLWELEKVNVRRSMPRTRPTESCEDSHPIVRVSPIAPHSRCHSVPPARSRNLDPANLVTMAKATDRKAADTATRWKQRHAEESEGDTDAGNPARLGRERRHRPTDSRARPRAAPPMRRGCSHVSRDGAARPVLRGVSSLSLRPADPPVG